MVGAAPGCASRSGRRTNAVRRPVFNARGATVLEMLFAVALSVTLAGMAAPAFFAGLDETRARGAARYLAGRVRLARAMAAARSRTIGLRFERSGDDYTYGVYQDGDRDGLRTADIAGGIDGEVSPPERLGAWFPGVRFCLLDGVPAIGDDAGVDPVRAGAADILSLSPDGSATAATLYVCSGKSQYAVRVLGITGRTRVLQFDRGSATWSER